MLKCGIIGLFAGSFSLLGLLFSFLFLCFKGDFTATAEIKYTILFQPLYMYVDDLLIFLIIFLYLIYSMHSLDAEGKAEE